MISRKIASMVVLVTMILAMTSHFEGNAAKKSTMLARVIQQPSGQMSSVIPNVKAALPPRDHSTHRLVMFIENVGQWEESARFQVWSGTATTMWLAENAIWITALEYIPGDFGTFTGLNPILPPTQRVTPSPRRGINIKLSFVNANSQVQIEPTNHLDTTVGYFIGDNNQTRWQSDVPVWAGVRFQNLYPGVDLELTSEANQITPNLVVRPGANLDAIRLRVEGADTVMVEGDALHLSTAVGELTLPLLGIEGLQITGPTVEASGEQTYDVITPFVRTNSNSRSQIDNLQYPDDNPADLLYGTFLGGGLRDVSYAITVDDTGNAYVTGFTESSDFPTTPGVFDPNHNNLYDAFVVKFNSTGSGLVYATFLGGSDVDIGFAIAVDEVGNTYMTGRTQSPDFPTTLSSFDTSYNGGIDTFVVKLNSAGSGLIYSTFLGGGSDDTSQAIVVDETHNTYVTGNTYSNDFPVTPSTFDPNFNGGQDAYVIKLNPAGNGLTFATFLGGSGNDNGSGIGVNEMNETYVTGETYSNDFPVTPGTFDPSFNGNQDAYVVKFNQEGDELVYSTFLGGPYGDLGQAIAVDETNNAYVMGIGGQGFPTTPGAYDPSFNGFSDAFVAKLNPAGSGLAYATYLGGIYVDYGNAMTVDRMGSTYVTGSTLSSDFPTTPGAFDTSYNGGYDAFVVRLDPAGSRLMYATYVGGGGEEESIAIDVDETDIAYATGRVDSGNFPITPGAFDTSHNGSYDAFIIKLAVLDSQPCCDFDGDGTVDVDDLVIIGDLWNQPAAAPYDQDGDGVITIVDVQRVARWWGTSIP